jgi:hypothetical protein
VADRVADGAEPLEVGLACEIEGARRGRLGRRAQHGGQPDALAGDEAAGLARGQAYAHPGRRLGRRQAGDRQMLQHHPAAGRLGLDRQHLAGHRRRPVLLLQHRRGDQRRARLGRREARGERAQDDQRQPRPGPRPEHGQRREQQAQTRRAEPKRRLGRQQEVDADAGAQPDRQPERPALALGLQRAGQAEGQQAQERHGLLDCAAACQRVFPGRHGA